MKMYYVTPPKGQKRYVFGGSIRTYKLGNNGYFYEEVFGYDSRANHELLSKIWHALAGQNNDQVVLP